MDKDSYHFWNKEFRQCVELSMQESIFTIRVYGLNWKTHQVFFTSGDVQLVMGLVITERCCNIFSNMCYIHFTSLLPNCTHTLCFMETSRSMPKKGIIVLLFSYLFKKRFLKTYLPRNECLLAIFGIVLGVRAYKFFLDLWKHSDLTKLFPND